MTTLNLDDIAPKAGYEKKKTHHLVVNSILLAPCLLVLLWHLCNHGLPTDDAADFASVAVRISNEFHHGLLPGIRACFATRGWRPIAFPPLAVPFLLLTGNDVVAACAATLMLIYLAITLYLYRLAYFLTADPVLSAATSSFVVSIPGVATFSVLFFAELAWILCSVACAYHLLVSGPFRDVTKSLLAGTFGGLMATMRPIESFIALTTLVLVLAFAQVRAGNLSVAKSAMSLVPFTVPLSLLVASTWLQEITRFYILVTCAAAILVAVCVAGGRTRCLVSFFTGLTSIICIWWAGFMASLFAWAYETSFGNMARIIGARQVAQAFSDLVGAYGRVQMSLLAAILMLLMASVVIKLWRSRGRSWSGQEFLPPAWLLLFASGITIVIFAVLYTISHTGDPRRALVGLILFAVSLLSIAGSRSVLARVAVISLVGAQCVVIGSAVAGTAVPVMLQKFGGIPEPHRDADGDIEAARILAQHVTPGSMIAVYTVALFESRARIYEPGALQLASVQGNYDYGIGYIWDSGSYDDVIARLRQGNYRYLLLDSFSEVSAGSSRMPYVQFASDLIRRTQYGRIDLPELRRVYRFRLGDREHVLFRLLPQNSFATPQNLGADINGGTAIASEEQKGFLATNLNDGTDAAWGSAEGSSDVYAGVLLPTPHAINEVQLRLFTPAGRPHLRNIRIVTAASGTPARPDWLPIRARLKGTKAFSYLLTIPPLPDNSIVTIEIDRSDPQWRPHIMWGFACLRSQGDLPNYIPAGAGTGVYVREFEIK